MTTHTPKRAQDGFSLIELLVVATIIIVLTTIGVMSFRNAGQNARDSKRKADIESVRQALVLRRADAGDYPTSGSQSAGGYTSAVSTLIGADYLTAPAPADPKNTGTTIYTYSSDGSSFCLCANAMENTANGNNPSCYGGSGAYCVENP